MLGGAVCSVELQYDSSVWGWGLASTTLGGQYRCCSVVRVSHPAGWLCGATLGSRHVLRHVVPLRVESMEVRGLKELEGNDS